MIVKLFIVAYSPFITDTAHHRLCLIVRRKGPISESGLSVPIGETEVPIIARSPDIYDHRRNPVTDVLIPETRRCLGGPVSTFITKQSMKHGRLVLFKNDKDPHDTTIWYGVHVDEIFDQALLPASYGCLDAFDHNDLSSQMKEAKKITEGHTSTQASTVQKPHDQKDGRALARPHEHEPYNPSQSSPT